MCLATISAMAQAPRVIDGRGVVYNGNNNFMLTLYGGAQYFGDFSQVTGKDIHPLGGAEIVYNYYGLRLSLGGAWGSEQSSYAQAGIYWNFINNVNRKHRAYIGITGGVIQYNSIIDARLVGKGTSTPLDASELTKLKLTLPPNSIAPIVGARLGVDWRLGRKIYLTTAVEGIYNFINKKVNFNTVEGELPMEDGSMKLEFKPSDDPIPVKHWGAKVIVGLSIIL